MSDITPAAKRVKEKMMSWIPPIYENSQVMNILYGAIATEWEEVEQIIAEIKDQTVPQTATWGLVYWEQLFNIPTNTALTYQQRRDAVLVKASQRVNTTIEKLQSEILNQTHVYVFISNRAFDENNNYISHTFLISYRAVNSITDAKIKRIVEEYKPAHLSVQYKTITNVWAEFGINRWQDLSAIGTWGDVLYNELL